MKEADDLTGFFTIGYRLVNGVKESVKYGLTYIYATYQDMLQAIKDLRSLEATVEGNEDSRVTAETGRNAAEQARKTAESGRVSAESNRVTAEGIRVSQENARKSAESTRVTAETNRVSAEDTRKVAESARSTEEGKRVAAESTRVNAESDRASAEGTRVSQETARKTAETARASAETIRVSQEDARKAAETARVTTETNRISAEDARKVAESARSTEEGKRVAAESARVTAETNRASAESTRVSQETTRKTTEAARVNTESSRVSAETSRATAETARVTAENKRVTEFGTLKQTVEMAASNANDTASHATYIGPDHYVYTWNKTTKAYDKTDIYCKGDAFSVKKVYASMSALQADVNNAGIKVGDFVLVNTDNVENPDNACLYVKSKNVSGVFSYDFLVDMSGAIGFTGKTPQLSIGTVLQGAAPAVTLSENGVDASGNPRYKLNLVLPQGEKGEAPVLAVGTVTTGAPGSQASASLVANGSTSTGAPRYNLNLTIPQGPQGPGNVQVAVTGLLAGKNYLFKPSANGSANGTLVEYAPSQSDWSVSDAASPSFIKNKPATFTPSAHKHVKGDITDFPSSMPASDVPSWAKQSSKPTYTAAEVGALAAGGTANKAVDSDTVDGLHASSFARTNGSGASGTWGISITGSAASATSAGSATTANSATTAAFLPTLYNGGVKSDPQEYFGQNIGLRVAMTGVAGYWSDTLWVNGYSGGDVLPCTALHFNRNFGAYPRLWVSLQNSNATSYGTMYEVWTSYNLSKLSQLTNDAGFITASGSCNYATSAGSAAYSNQLQAFTGDNFTGGEHFVKAIRSTSGWSTRLWMCYNGGTKQSDVVEVNYANSAGNADTVDGYHAASFYRHDEINTGWFRSTGTQGWYSDTYGGGIYMTDTTYVRTYHNKAMAAAGGFYKDSDIRLKTDVNPLSHTLEQLLSIPTASFVMDNKQQIGTIAQLLEDVCPEVVTTCLTPKSELPDNDAWNITLKDGEEYVDVKRVEYEMIGVLALEAVKLLAEEIKQLKEDLKNGK